MFHDHHLCHIASETDTVCTCKLWTHCSSLGLILLLVVLRYALFSITSRHYEYSPPELDGYLVETRALPESRLHTIQRQAEYSSVSAAGLDQWQICEHVNRLIACIRARDYSAYMLGRYTGNSAGFLCIDIACYAFLISRPDCRNGNRWVCCFISGNLPVFLFGLKGGGKLCGRMSVNKWRFQINRMRTACKWKQDTHHGSGVVDQKITITLDHVSFSIKSG